MKYEKPMYRLSDCVGLFKDMKETMEKIEPWITPEDFTVESAGFIPSMLECLETQVSQLKIVVRKTPEYLEPLNNDFLDSLSDTKMEEKK